MDNKKIYNDLALLFGGIAVGAMAIEGTNYLSRPLITVNETPFIGDFNFTNQISYPVAITAALIGALVGFSVARVENKTNENVILYTLICAVLLGSSITLLDASIRQQNAIMQYTEQQQANQISQLQQANQ